MDDVGFMRSACIKYEEPGHCWPGSPFSMWSGTPYQFHSDSRTREACDSHPCREMQRGGSMLPSMAACGRKTACRRRRAVARPWVWSLAALRHRLPRRANRNPDSVPGAPLEARNASALRAEPSSGRWSFVHRRLPDFMIIRLPVREFSSFCQNRVEQQFFHKTRPLH